MSEQRIASRYSKALFDKACEEGILDIVKDNIDELISLSEDSRDFLLFIHVFRIAWSISRFGKL